MTLLAKTGCSAKSFLLLACLAAPVIHTKENIIHTLTQTEFVTAEQDKETQKNNSTTRADTIDLDTLLSTLQNKIPSSQPDLDKVFFDKSTKNSLFYQLAQIDRSTGIFAECDWQAAFDELCSRHPEAKRHKNLMEKSYFLYEGRYIYLDLQEKIRELLRLTQSEHVGTYAWFMWHSRALSAQTKKHIYLTETYIDYLIEQREQQSSNENKDLSRIQELFSPGKQSLPTKSFARTDHEDIRYDTLTVTQLAKKDTITLQSKHLPHHQATKQLDALGYTVVSSKTGEDDGSCDSSTRTCTHGLQPIVISGLHQLEEKIMSIYGVPMDHKIIRGGTERGHFYGTQKSGLIAGQADPGYNKHLHVHTNNNITNATIKRPRLFFTMHGYGSTIDLSIGSPERVRAMEDFLSTGKSIGLGYRLISLGSHNNDEELYMISMKHGKGISYHYHIGFATETQLIQTGLLPEKDHTPPHVDNVVAQETTSGTHTEKDIQETRHEQKKSIE